MGFSDRVERATYNQRPPWRTCHACWGLARIAEEHGQAEADAVVKAFAVMSGRELEREVFEEFGIRVTAESWRRHRNRVCGGGR